MNIYMNPEFDIIEISDDVITTSDWGEDLPGTPDDEWS